MDGCCCCVRDGSVEKRPRKDFVCLAGWKVSLDDRPAREAVDDHQPQSGGGREEEGQRTGGGGSATTDDDSIW